MGQQDIILDIVRKQGPLLPIKVAKALGTDLLIASAQLSELVDSKKLRFSNIKVGGSPLYYIEGQEGKLQDFSENLNNKDKEAFDLLKSKKVLMDERLSPLLKVSIREIKDFAVPLQVTYNNKKTIFWKWYLLGNNEAEKFISSYLEQGEMEVKAPVENQKKTEEERKKAEEAQKIEKEKIELEKIKVEEEKKKAAEQKSKEETEKKKAEEQKKIEEEKKRKEIEQKRISEQKKLQEERKKLEDEKKKLREEKKKIELERKAELEKIETQKNLETTSEKVPKEQTIEDEFLKQLIDFFKQKGIIVVEHEIVKKKTEIDFILKIPSVVGQLDYYCKARNKKKINEGDLTSAFVQGQLKKLPVLMIVKGEMTKKAQELLNIELNKGIIVNKI